jgi:hypothetical protein
VPADDRRSFDFKRFSIVLHFVQKPGEYVRNSVDGNELNPFDSFSEDMLAYEYASGRSSRADSKPAIESEIVPLKAGQETVKLSMREAIEFEAEGERKTLPLPPRLEDEYGARWLRRLAVKASRTIFPSDYAICHLAFVDPPEPGPDDFLDEYDVVVLSKLWQGGEHSNVADNVFVHQERGGQESPVGAFAKDIFRHQGRAGLDVRIGTVQLITDSTSSDVDWNEIWKAVEEYVKPAGEDELDETLKKRVIALGGIVAGVLDFEEIDPTELADVFGPHKRDTTSLIGIHKGTLLYVVDSDRSYDVVAESIGVSPYLLLPQAVLLHNEALLDCAAKRAKNLDECAAKRAKGMERENDPAALENCFTSMRKDLSLQEPNVFHYPRERWLFDEGERTRGLSARRMRLAEEALEIEKRWNVAVEKRNVAAATQNEAAAKRLDRRFKILAGLFGILSLAELLSWTNQAFHVRRLFWAWVELGALVLAGLVVGFIYWKSLREPEEAQSESG